MSSVSRPFGVTLLAILHLLQAVLFFLGGIALIAIGAIVARSMFGIHRFLGGATSLIGVVLVVLGLLYLGLALGLWMGKGWAWTLSLIIAALGVIISLLSLLRGRVVTFLVLILDIVILYYLLTPRVRTFFGQYKTPAPGVAAQASSQSTIGSGPRYCPNCGAPVQTDEKFCLHCGKPLSG